MHAFFFKFFWRFKILIILITQCPTCTLSRFSSWFDHCFWTRVYSRYDIIHTLSLIVVIMIIVLWRWRGHATNRGQIIVHTLVSFRFYHYYCFTAECTQLLQFRPLTAAVHSTARRSVRLHAAGGTRPSTADTRETRETFYDRYYVYIIF